MKLRTARLGRYWWIVGDEEDGPYGPYDTRAEAEDDRKGIRRFERFPDDVSVDLPPPDLELV